MGYFPSSRGADSCQQVAAANRYVCGWPGISQGECTSNRCCYDRYSGQCFQTVERNPESNVEYAETTGYNEHSNSQEPEEVNYD
jgi:hypothetical protein